MVRLTGWITVEGRKVPLDWTVTEEGIVSASVLSAAEVSVHHDAPAPEPVTLPEPVEEATSEEEAPATTDYESMNKTDLMVLCSQRGLSQSGTKAEIIERLVADDAASTSTTEGEDDADATE